MSTREYSRLRVIFTALVMMAELAHLAWEYFNGGVVSHHLLARSDLPAVSNWWGLVLLPALAWFATGRVGKRMASRSSASDAASTLPMNVIVGLVAALLLGALLSFAFTQGYESMASSLFVGMFVLAVLLRVYRAECLLGFVLGMTFTFGAVLPTLIGSLIAAVSAIVHLGIRPLLARLWRRFKRAKSVTA